MLPAPVTAPAVVTPVAEATGLASWAWLLIAVPAVSAALLLLAGRRSNAWGHWLGLAASLTTACLGVGILLLGVAMMLVQYRRNPAFFRERFETTELPVLD